MLSKAMADLQIAQLKARLELQKIATASVSPRRARARKLRQKPEHVSKKKGR